MSLPPSSQQINLLYFGHLVEILGRESEYLFLPLTVKDIRALMAHLARRGEHWQTVFASPPPNLNITVNKQFAEPDTPIKGGDEIAFVAFSMA
ncbi:MAG: molybdopterin synthase sulfur carrier subunit [Hydrogenophilales bacterium CG_4_9_14_3_um_filter_63_34]|nr:MAG: molybdopterin synthase sulfur carrier subunit [Hydrogenophilales bacterium CG_4_10_14_3_um_filter_63_21]PJB07768.1 MAG: molybdopterin synthase sulfur carrier subunit [Hydrogenophilales bacterium CG_4_9_14_3_um_filter_63_34]